MNLRTPQTVNASGLATEKWRASRKTAKKTGWQLSETNLIGATSLTFAFAQVQPDSRCVG